MGSKFHLSHGFQLIYDNCLYLIVIIETYVYLCFGLGHFNKTTLYSVSQPQTTTWKLAEVKGEDEIDVGTFLHMLVSVPLVSS